MVLFTGQLILIGRQYSFSTPSENSAVDSPHFLSALSYSTVCAISQSALFELLYSTVLVAIVFPCLVGTRQPFHLQFSRAEGTKSYPNYTGSNQLANITVLILTSYVQCAVARPYYLLILFKYFKLLQLTF